MKIKQGFLLVTGALFLTACASKTATVSEAVSVAEDPVPVELATLEIELHTFPASDATESQESVEQESSESDGFDDTVDSSEENETEDVNDDSAGQLAEETEDFEQLSENEVTGDDEPSDFTDTPEYPEEIVLTDETLESEIEEMLPADESEESESEDTSDEFDDSGVLDVSQLSEGVEDLPESVEESVEPVVEEQITLVTEDAEQIPEINESDTSLYSEEWDQEAFYELEDEPELIFSDDEEYQIPEPDNSLAATVGDPLVISFETSGWVYLGDLLDSDVIQFDKRQNGLYSTVFTFSVQNSGTALLEFWSVDPLTGDDLYIRYQILAEDCVTVPSVEEKTSTEELDSRAFDVVQEAPVTESIVQSMYTPSVTPVEESVTPYTFEPLDEIVFNQWTKDEIISFFEDPEVVAYYGEESVLYYEAQIFETHATAKDIRRSVHCYEELVKKYPTSKWWDSARERSKYLRKYYFL